jgi:hypothetical protein
MAGTDRVWVRSRFVFLGGGFFGWWGGGYAGFPEGAWLVTTGVFWNVVAEGAEHEQPF